MEDPFPSVDDDDAAQREEQARRDVEALMLTPNGRRLMWSILADLATFDAVSGERQAGRHEAGRELLSRVKRANLELYHTMIEEHDV